MANPVLVLWSLIIAVPLMLFGVISVSLLVISAFGGWRRLAAFFPAIDLPSGRRFLMQSGSVGWVNYSACLTIYTSADGIYLTTMWPFRAGHPPLFIPWSEIHDVTTRRLFGMEDAVFEVGLPSIAKMCLPKKVFEGRMAPREGEESP
jgi:hypothetical protein